MTKSILSLFFFGAVLSASPVSVSFVSATSEIGPYVLSVAGHEVQAMCMDDFLGVGGNWQADLTAVNSSDFSNTYLGNKSVSFDGFTVTSGQAYGLEADLFSQLLRPNADRTDIQTAAWLIMDPQALNNVPSANAAAVERILCQTMSNYSSFSTSGYEIVSQVDSGWDPEQEFMIRTSVTPEPASLALFGAGLVAAGIFRFTSRNKKASAA
jgi:hypothetical protein